MKFLQEKHVVGKGLYRGHQNNINFFLEFNAQSSISYTYMGNKYKKQIIYEVSKKQRRSKSNLPLGMSFSAVPRPCNFHI